MGKTCINCIHWGEVVSDEYHVCEHPAIRTYALPNVEEVKLGHRAIRAIGETDEDEDIQTRFSFGCNLWERRI